MRTPSALAILALGAFVLSACSAQPPADLGDTQEVKVRQPEVTAQAAVTVTEVEAQPVAALQDQLQLPADFADGTVFLAHYTAKIIDGDYPADSAYGFSEYNWAAGGMDDAEIAVVNAIFPPDMATCQTFSADLAAELAAGSEISACVIFVSEKADAKIETVTYGQAAVSRRGSGSGWTWTVAD